MLLTFIKQNLSIDLLHLSELDKNILNSEGTNVINFIRSWSEDIFLFNFYTSGSTGNPKLIQLSRNQLRFSAHQTLNYLDINKNGKILLCINPSFIGGAMVIVRALESQMNLDILPPTNDFSSITDNYELVSLVPLQLESILNESPDLLNNFKNILVGGAKIDSMLENELLKKNLKSNIFSTYGMTETASHIALRKIGEENFNVIGDNQIAVDKENCLKVKGSSTDKKWIQTNDIVELMGTKRFLWKGRRDFIINSGGFKVSPELVESKIEDQLLGNNFMISAVPDKKYGEKVVLILEKGSSKIELSFDCLHPFERPKEIFYFDSIIKNGQLKIDRLANQKKLISILSK